MELADLVRAVISLQRLLREPLLHFLVLGALLFVVYGWMHRDALRAPDEVVVDQARVDALAARFQRLWQREPSPHELRGLVDQWVRDEILYREGVAAGMERDDEVVRRRVAQKMTFLNEGTAVEVPTETELQAWLRAHPHDYRLAPRYTLRQVYFDPIRHGDALTRDIAKARASLQRDANANVGDAGMLPTTLQDSAADDVIRTFGAQFAQALPVLPDRRWSDPVASDFGVHLVWIDSRTPARMPALSQVRRDVERDLLAERTRKASDAFYDTLRKRYTIKVEADLGDTADRAHAVAMGAR